MEQDSASLKIWWGWRCLRHLGTSMVNVNSGDEPFQPPIHSVSRPQRLDQKTKFSVGAVTGRIDLCVRPAYDGDRCDDVAFLHLGSCCATIGLSDGAGAAGGTVSRLIAERCTAAAAEGEADTPFEIASVLRQIDVEATALDGAATALVVRMHPEGLHVVSAGDSEVWAIHADGVMELSRGQPRRRVGDGVGRPQIAGFLGHPTKLIAASDGLWKRMGAEAAFDVVKRSGPNPAREIVAAVADRIGFLPDDIAVVVVEFDTGRMDRWNEGATP